MPSPLDGVVLLDGDDRLTDGAMDIACDYNQVLFHGRDPASDWLPGWAWQRGEQVERLLFQSLIQSGGQDAYVASRRFVIERPAGASAPSPTRGRPTGIRRRAAGDRLQACPCGPGLPVRGRRCR